VNAATTQTLAAAVLRESMPGGAIGKHFVEQKSWEEQTRRRCRTLVGTLDLGRWPDEAKDLLHAINGYYHVHFPNRHLSFVAESIHSAVAAQNWWATALPMVLDLSLADAEADAISRVVADSVNNAYAKIVETHDTVRRHPYSLVTKFLHFCFPSTVPIYDRQVAVGIQMWSTSTYGQPEERQRFDVKHTTVTDASGYRGIIDFYRLVWEGALPVQRAALSQYAARLSCDVGVPLTVVDLIDNLLWWANGDARRLGLPAV
jgi:hypothetical protein